MEDLGGDNTDTRMNSNEVPLNSRWYESTDPLEVKSKEPIIAQEINKNIDSEQESNEENENEREEQIDTPKIPRRAPGRPKLLKTGKKGRPRKLYREITSEEEAIEPSSVGEIEDRTDRQL